MRWRNIYPPASEPEARKGFYSAVVILVIIIVAIFDVCNAADHAIVSFNDAEHLAALQDSVAGVCDTTTEIHCWYLDSDTTVTHYWEVTNCRRLVGVTVVPEPYGLNTYTTGAIIDVRQQAIIFYEEVKQ